MLSLSTSELQTVYGTPTSIPPPKPFSQARTKNFIKALTLVAAGRHPSDVVRKFPGLNMTGHDLVTQMARFSARSWGVTDEQVSDESRMMLGIPEKNNNGDFAMLRKAEDGLLRVPMKKKVVVPKEFEDVATQPSPETHEKDNAEGTATSNTTNNEAVYADSEENSSLADEFEEGATKVETHSAPSSTTETSQEDQPTGKTPSTAGPNKEVTAPEVQDGLKKKNKNKKKNKKRKGKKGTNQEQASTPQEPVPAKNNSTEEELIAWGSDWSQIASEASQTEPMSGQDDLEALGYQLTTFVGLCLVFGGFVLGQSFVFMFAF